MSASLKKKFRPGEKKKTRVPILASWDNGEGGEGEQGGPTITFPYRRLANSGRGGVLWSEKKNVVGGVLRSYVGTAGREAKTTRLSRRVMGHFKVLREKKVSGNLTSILREGGRGLVTVCDGSDREGQKGRCEKLKQEFKTREDARKGAEAAIVKESPLEQRRGETKSG